MFDVGNVEDAVREVPGPVNGHGFRLLKLERTDAVGMKGCLEFIFVFRLMLREILPRIQPTFAVGNEMHAVVLAWRSKFEPDKGPKSVKQEWLGSVTG